MKGFSDWVSDMLGSVPDPNNSWADEQMSKSITTKGKPRTKWQIRADFADLVVGTPSSEQEVEKWLLVFCIKNHVSEKDHGMIGDKAWREWVGADSDGDALRWWSKLVISIDNYTFDPEKD